MLYMKIMANRLFTSGPNRNTYTTISQRLLLGNFGSCSNTNPNTRSTSTIRLYSNKGWKRSKTYLDQILYTAGHGEPGTWQDPIGLVWGCRDPRFAFPGNVGFAPYPPELPDKFYGPPDKQPDPAYLVPNSTNHKSKTTTKDKTPKKPYPEFKSLTNMSNAINPDIIPQEQQIWRNVTKAPTNHQTQVSVLQHHGQVEKMHEEAKAAVAYAVEQIHFSDIEMLPNDCPELLRKDIRHMFRHVNLATGPLTVITFAHKTKNDMSSWSPDVEDERERLVEYFVDTAKKLCTELRVHSQWADFIDPDSGRPFYSPYTNDTFFETDERYRHLGFRINDLGCCKVISHIKWGTRAFVGSIFTTAPHDSEYLERIVSTYNNKVPKK